MAKRLFDTFKPDHYNLYLDVSRADKKFSGQTTITGTTNAATFQLNQKFLQIDAVKVDGQDVDFSFDDKSETITINGGKTGAITVVVDYHAKLTDTMMGIYPSYYQVDGVKKELVGTQFETTAFRQAFPGVDEPAAKATFSLAIKYDEKPGETIISNQPEEKVVNGVHYFKETVKMSSYLVAFVFGDMQKKLTHTKSGVEIGVFATKAHQAKELDFALDIAKRSIEFYEDFYQTPYPLEHSYQVALPDFSAGAMENWGCVTYREAYLLLDPDNTSLYMKQLVATVIAHELAHQWFGDLVTMQWWDNLWLNESFANMMEYVAIDALQPDWKIWEMFQTTEVAQALNRDATDGVQSVHVMVEDPAEIDSIFDGAIVYAKGSRMLVMVRALLGDDNLRKGLKLYFERHHYGNASGDDLWDALGEVSGLNIGEIMHSWLEQPGYPVVSAKVEDGKLVLTQKQFFIGEHVDKNRLWQIPLNANYKEAPQIMKDEKIVLGDYAELRAANGKAFKLNEGNNSHFIVKYDDKLLADLLDSDLAPVDQLQIIQDSRLQAQAGSKSYADLVPLLVKFSDTHSAMVFETIEDVASFLKNFVEPKTAAAKNLEKLFDKLSKASVERLGFAHKESDSVDDILLRPDVVRASVAGKNVDTKKALHDIFAAHEDNLAGIEASIRGSVLRNEVENFGSKELFDKLFKLYQETADPSFKSNITGAVTRTQDPELLDTIVERYEDASYIKPQDLRGWFSLVLQNPAGEAKAWSWLQNDWQWLSDNLGGDMEFPTFITVVARAFHTSKQLAEFKKFFEPKLDTPGLGREIKMDTNLIAGKAKLVESEADAVNEAIAKVL